MNLKHGSSQQKLDSKCDTRKKHLPPSIYHPIKTTDVSKELGEALFDFRKELL